MSLSEKLTQLIAQLEELKADLAKIEAGKTGQPGTRFRKEAKVVQTGIEEIRKEILNLRKQ